MKVIILIGIAILLVVHLVCTGKVLDPRHNFCAFFWRNCFKIVPLNFILTSPEENFEILGYSFGFFAENNLANM